MCGKGKEATGFNEGMWGVSFVRKKKILRTLNRVVGGGREGTTKKNYAH